MLDSQGARRYHSGLPRVHRSTLADANARRPAEVFTKLFAAMVGRLDRSMRRELSIRLNRLSGQWARFSADMCGVKAHIVYDPDAGRLVYLAVTPARVNDITAAKEMPISAGATYVFDLGYYDYGWWAKLDAAGCRIITRLKSNTPPRVSKRLPVAEGGNVLSDRIGLLPARLANSRSARRADAQPRRPRSVSFTRAGLPFPAIAFIT